MTIGGCLVFYKSYEYIFFGGVSPGALLNCVIIDNAKSGRSFKKKLTGNLKLKKKIEHLQNMF